MYMSQTFVWKHNYDERGTFKIYPLSIFGMLATANMSCSKTFFLVNSVYINNILNAHVHV